MPSTSGGLPQGPPKLYLWDNQKWKETNENLHEMLCLKFQW
jgi:hypothetical protein